jgi:hypothetical protein
VARGAAQGNPAVSEQVLRASRDMLDDLMLVHANDARPARPPIAANAANAANVTS